MFLLRVVFWVALVAFFWPQSQSSSLSSDLPPQAGPSGSGFEPGGADQIQSGVAHTISTFCYDYEIVCDVGDATLDIAVTQAAYLTGELHDWLERKADERNRD